MRSTHYLVHVAHKEFFSFTVFFSLLLITDYQSLVRLIQLIEVEYLVTVLVYFFYVLLSAACLIACLVVCLVACLVACLATCLIACLVACFNSIFTACLALFPVNLNLLRYLVILFVSQSFIVFGQRIFNICLRSCLWEASLLLCYVYGVLSIV